LPGSKQKIIYIANRKRKLIILLKKQYTLKFFFYLNFYFFAYVALLFLRFCFRFFFFFFQWFFSQKQFLKSTEKVLLEEKLGWMLGKVWTKRKNTRIELQLARFETGNSKPCSGFIFFQKWLFLKKNATWAQCLISCYNFWKQPWSANKKVSTQVRPNPNMIFWKKVFSHIVAKYIWRKKFFILKIIL